MAAPLPDVITIVRGSLHDGDLDRSSATGFGDLANRASKDLITPVVAAECRYDQRFDLTEPDRVITVCGLTGTIEVKQALASA